MKDAEPILEAPIEAHLRAAVPPAEADRMWRSLKLREQATPRRNARRRVAIGAGLGLALAAAAAAAFVLWPRGAVDAPPPGPLALEGGHALPATLGSHEGPSVFDLNDGSRIVLAPSTDARVVANDARVVRTALARGSATFDVRPGGPRRWIVEAGEARVEVLGTRFTVERTEDAVRVHVARGVVAVHAPGAREPQRLTAGQSVIVRATEPRAAAEPALEAPATAEPAPIPEEGATSPAPSTELTAPAPEAADAWRARALRGDFAGAYRRLGVRGLRDAARGASAEDVLLLADVARRSGHPADAMPLYDQLVRSSPGDVRAPVAAFTLGRLQLEGSPAAAADSFAFVRAHPAAAALREDATALEAEAAARAGQPSRARRVAGEYLERFPEGRRADAMRPLAEAP